MARQLSAVWWAHRRRIQAAQRGQSLAEFTLVLPILLLIVAGVLEVGNILTIYNRVQLAAREGARFGAAGGADILSIIDQASRESLNLAEDQMTVWVVRPVIDTEHTGLDGQPWTWQDATLAKPWGVDEECIFGDLCDAGTQSPVTPTRVLDHVRRIGTTGTYHTSIDGNRFVVVVIYYRVDTILNLPFFKIPGESQGRVPVWAFGVFNQEVEQQAVALLQGGCSAYPLALNANQIPPGAEEGTIFGPVRLNNEKDDLNLDGFGFLGWNVAHRGVDDLTASCNNPIPGAICTSAVSLRDDVGFEEFGDPGDTELHRGDWVLSSGINDSQVSNVQEDLNDHQDAGRTLRVIVYNYAFDAGTGTPLDPKLVSIDATHTAWQYQVAGFAIVRIKEIQWSPGDIDADKLTFEFIRWDFSCGYDT